MANSGIGIPQIEPRHRAVWQDAHRAPNLDKDKDKDGGAGKRDRPPPEPGTGEIIDKAV